jgi:hypothetical protein
MSLQRSFWLTAVLSLLLPPLSSHAGDEANVSALEAKCEQAREVRLKPLRDAEIKKCKEEQQKDPEYCERYWRDYGDAMRLPNRTIKPRMFDDLPECVAAQEARNKLKQG